MTTPGSIEERMARLEGSYEQIDRRLATLEQDLRSGFEHLTGRIDQMDARVNSRIDRLTYWLMGLLAAVATSVVATIVTRIV